MAIDSVGNPLPLGGGAPAGQQAPPGLMQMLMQRLQDPNVRNALFAAGAGMMQPATGANQQNALGMMGVGLSQGVDTLNRLRTLDRQAALEASKVASAERLAREREAGETSRLTTREAGLDRRSAAQLESQERIIQQQNELRQILQDQNLTMQEQLARMKDKLDRDVLATEVSEAEKDRALQLEVANIRKSATSPQLALIDKLAEDLAATDPGKFGGPLGQNFARLVAFQTMQEAENNQSPAALTAQVIARVGPALAYMGDEGTAMLAQIVDATQRAAAGQGGIGTPTLDAAVEQANQTVNPPLYPPQPAPGPNRQTATGMPLMYPGTAAQQAPGAGPQQIRSQEEWAALPPGTPYYDPNGVYRVKR